MGMSTQPIVGGGGSLDFGKGFQFVFEDPEWIKKVLVGGLFVLLSSVFVGLLFLGGYFLRLIQRAARGEPRPLPGWDDLGGILTDGVKACGLYLIGTAVAALVPLSLGCVLFVLGGGMSALLGASRDLAGAAAGALVLGVVAFYVTVAAVALVLLVFLPAALLRLALTGRFGAGFEWREILAFIARNPGNYALSLLLYLLASVVAQFGILLLCVGIFPAVFWSYCLLGWALGETARRDPGTALAP